MRQLKIHQYSSRFPEIFENIKKRIIQAVGDYEIHHIGSTAVPSLGGKGIIDIMLAINKWKEASKITKQLKSIGFSHIHPKEDNRIFVSNKKESGFGDFHIHIVKRNSEEYKDLLFFRDYLRSNKEEIGRLFKLKLKWQKQSQGDWKLYNKFKLAFVKAILKNALKPKPMSIL